MLSPIPTTPDEVERLLESKHLLLSNAGALMHVIKGTVGTGILGLPWAIKHAGIILGPVVMVFIGIINLHCMQLLVKSARHLAKTYHTAPLDYGDAAYMAVLHGPIKFLRPHAEKAKVIVNLCLEITQLGLCCTYTVFVGQNVRQVVAVYWEEAPIDRAFMAMLFVPFILISLIKNLSILAWFSSAANIAGVISICMMLRFILPDLPPVSSLPYVEEPSGFSVFVGATIGAFEGIPVILPVGNAMRTPEDFHLIINLGIGFIIFLYVSIAFIGYLKFDGKICGSITLNLPIVSPYYDTVRILYAFAMFATFPLQFYVAMEIIETFVLAKCRYQGPCCSVLTRILVVALICLVSISIPFIGDLNALIGATSSTMLVILFPPLMHIMAYSDSKDDADDEYDEDRSVFADEDTEPGGSESSNIERLSNWMLAKDLIIAGLAFLAFITGLTETTIRIVDDVQHYNSEHECSGGVGKLKNETLEIISFIANISMLIQNKSSEANVT